MKRSKRKPWYAGGLRFECQRCSRCCRGEPGYVWVTDAEIARMAEFLGITRDEFLGAHVRRVGLRRSLTELPGGDCSLWGGHDRGCLVYPVRPVQCQTFPFWREHLTSAGAWKELAAYCPGVNKGPLVSRKTIEAHLRRR